MTLSNLNLQTWPSNDINGNNFYLRLDAQMGKRLCKLSRNDIAQSLSNIQQLVKQPRYLCRSCARSSSEAQWLCSPESLPVSIPLTKSNTQDRDRKNASNKQKAIMKKLKKLVKKQNKLQTKKANLELKFNKK